MPKPVEIEADTAFVCDRSLDGSRFGQATGYKAPGWDDLVGLLAADPTPYDARKEKDRAGKPIMSGG